MIDNKPPICNLCWAQICSPEYTDQLIQLKRYWWTVYVKNIDKRQLQIKTNKLHLVSVIGSEKLSIGTILLSYKFIQIKSNNTNDRFERSLRTWIFTTGPSYGLTFFSNETLTNILLNNAKNSLEIVSFSLSRRSLEILLKIYFWKQLKKINWSKIKTNQFSVVCSFKKSISSMLFERQYLGSPFFENRIR